MRLANLNGRAVLVIADESGHDVATLSSGRSGPDLPRVSENWEAFRAWVDDLEPAGPGERLDRVSLGPPSPAPRQILAVGLNYSKHAAEAGFEPPAGLPPVFTKFVSALAGPDCTVTLPPDGHTDWEVELVVVIGASAREVTVEDAWSHVAGLTLGQDLSERIRQMAATPPQFSLGKSHERFAPTGPWLVTPDELENSEDIAIGCSIDGEVVQSGRTSELIYSIPRLVSELSQVVTLLPGDLVFTGTPDGVGLGRTPQRWLEPGNHLRSWAEGIGELNQRFVAR